MKKLNWNGEYERYRCSRARANQLMKSGRDDFEIIVVTPKWVVVEFRSDQFKQKKD